VFVKHSLKNIVRSWPKSTLFFILLTALGATLCIGMSLTTSILSFLKECDENYTTIAVFEYIGVDYPDESRLDPDIARCCEEFDFDSLSKNPDVLNWDSNAVAFGYIAGKTAKAADPAYKDYSVTVIYILSFNVKNDAFQYSVIADLLHPDADVQGGYINSDEVDFEIGHMYLIHGKYTSARSHGEQNTVIRPVTLASAVKAGVNVAEQSLIVDVTAGRGDYELPSFPASKRR